MSGLNLRILGRGTSSASSLRVLQRELQAAVGALSQSGLPIAFAFIHVDGVADLSPGGGDKAHEGLFQRSLALIRRANYEHEARALAVQTHVLLLLPYRAPEEALDFCEKLLGEAHDMEVRGAGGTRQITLSIGLAYPDRDGMPPVAGTLMSLSATRARAATAAGGDRVVSTEPEAEAVDEDPSRALVEKDDRSELFRTRQELAEVQAELAKANLESAGEAAGRADLLERRVQKLLDTLEKTESELARVSAGQVEDFGTPSEYRNVQGLSSVDDQYELKSDLMQSLFEANVDLQQGLKQNHAKESA